MVFSFKHRLLNLIQLLSADIVEIPVALEPAHLPGLDGLRGISIIIVIVCHFAMFTPVSDYFYGDIGVETFFVISGFLITTLLLKEKVKRGTVSFRNFYIRRLLRIVPASYLVLVVLIVLNTPLSLGIPGTHFFMSFLYIRNIPSENFYEWHTGHFWSLSVEEQFYLIFPFFIVLRTNKFFVFSILLILLIPVLTFLAYGNIGIFYSNKIVHLFTVGVVVLLGKGTTSILVGALFSILLFKKIIVVESLKGSYFTGAVLFFIAGCTLTNISYLHVDYLSQMIFPVIIVYVIMLNLKEKNFLRLFLDNALMVKIGLLSYSLYVWQQLFTSKQQWHLFRYSDSIIVRLLLLVAISYISYNYYERVFLKFKKKFKVV